LTNLISTRFTEKQAKVLRDIKMKLQTKPAMKNGNSSEPVPVTKARLLFRSCLDSTATDKLQFGPLFRNLKDYKLPRVPSMINDPEAVDIKFDWIKSIVKVKRSLGADKLIGFEICEYILRTLFKRVETSTTIFFIAVFSSKPQKSIRKVSGARFTKQ
jgi:hypothetical protein